MQIQFRRPYHGQSQRDPSAQKPGTHKPGDRRCCRLRPQHGHTHISPCSGAAAWLAASAVHVAARSLTESISTRNKGFCLQDAGLRMGTPRDAEERRYPEPAVGGILRAVPSERRAALQIHPIQQVLRRLCPQNESHHASGAQARRDHAGGLGGPDGSAGGHRHRGAGGWCCHTAATPTRRPFWT